MNNKGVTLIELLIVIVVLGIISAFAIPAVGSIISNTEKDAVLADALAIENAAKTYCGSKTCTATELAGLTWDNVSEYISSFDETLYEETDDVAPAGATLVAQNGSGDWVVTLTKAAANADAVYGFTAGVPSDSDRTSVTGP